MTYSEFFCNFSRYVSYLFTDLSYISSFRYDTALEVHANGIFVLVDGLAILPPVTNSTCCVRRPTDEIFHLSAIAQMAARMVAQVESLRKAHTRARRSP